MQQYRVGQILFLIADASKVVPIQVVEEVIRTTLEGKEKTYIVKFPDKKGTTADIKKVKGELFKSKTEVKQYMIENAKSAIEQMVSLAEEMSINIFNTSSIDNAQYENFNQEPNKLEIKNKKEEEVQQPEDDGIIRVDLGNGKFGKINVDNLNNAGAPQ
jgi:L-lactate utilization protein LutC